MQPFIAVVEYMRTLDKANEAAAQRQRVEQEIKRVRHQRAQMERLQQHLTQRIEAAETRPPRAAVPSSVPLDDVAPQ